MTRLTEAGAATLDALLAGTAGGAAAAGLARRLLDAGVLVTQAHPHPDPPPRSELTVVVPVRDDAAGLRRCLRGVRDRWPDVAVVVADDGSRDGRSIDSAAEEYGARVIRVGNGRGPAAARNTALGEVHTPYVVLIDADVELDGADPWPRWWSLLEDPTVAVVAPRVRGTGGEGGAGVYERARFPLDLGGLASRIAPDARVTYAPAALLVVRNAAVDGVGGFDVDLRYGEDVDLLWRLVDAGWRCRYDPVAAATHPVRPGPVARMRQRYRYGTSAAPLAARHGGRLAPWRGSRWTAVVVGLVVGGHPVAAAGVTVANAVALHRRLGGRGVEPLTSLRLVVVGHVGSGRVLFRALVRPWWPLTLAGSTLLSVSARRRLLVGLMVPALAEWSAARPPLDPLRWAWWWLVDDLSYSAGVWVGWWHLRRRSATASLLPGLIEWPGRRRGDPLTRTAGGS